MTGDRSRLRGSFPPVLVPFRDGEIDHGSYERLVDHLVTNGSHGLVCNGTTGEPTTLTADERTELVKRAVAVAAGRVPVVAATGSQSLVETVELTRAAQAGGADAVMVVTPYYSKPPQRGLVEYFATVARATDLPVLVYHIPGRAGVSLEVSTLEAIVERAPNVVGLKHSAYDLLFLTDVIARLGPEFHTFVGVEELTFPMLAIGAVGMVNAAANVAPRQIADLYDAVVRGDLDAGRHLHFELFELNRSVFWDTNPIAVKYMAARLGLIERNEHRLPLAPATPELAARLDGVLERLGLL